jgi:hypothetical protein
MGAVGLNGDDKAAAAQAFGVGRPVLVGEEEILQRLPEARAFVAARHACALRPVGALDDVDVGARNSGAPEPLDRFVGVLATVEEGRDRPAAGRGGGSITHCSISSSLRV